MFNKRHKFPVNKLSAQTLRLTSERFGGAARLVVFRVNDGTDRLPLLLLLLLLLLTASHVGGPGRRGRQRCLVLQGLRLSGGGEASSPTLAERRDSRGARYELGTTPHGTE